MLHDSGCMTLSSQCSGSTGKLLIHFAREAYIGLLMMGVHEKSNVGFFGEVDQQLALAARVESCQDFQKCIAILIDEMYVKEDLVYNKHTDARTGFANLGDINAHLLAFEHSLSQKIPTNPPLATTMMTYMVQDLFTQLGFPYAHFPCSKVTGSLLFSHFWEAVYHLERLQLKVFYMPQ